jgi:F420-dependent methylenetetrahydromethanopterin dehydrogenase
VSGTQARLDAITVALDRLLEQDSWEQPYVNAGREALTALAAELERVTAAAASVEKTLDDYLRLGISPSREMWYAARDSLRAALTGGARAAQEDK